MTWPGQCLTGGGHWSLETWYVLGTLCCCDGDGDGDGHDDCGSGLDRRRSRATHGPDIVPGRSRLTCRTRRLRPSPNVAIQHPDVGRERVEVKKGGTGGVQRAPSIPSGIAMDTAATTGLQQPRFGWRGSDGCDLGETQLGRGDPLLFRPNLLSCSGRHPESSLSTWTTVYTRTHAQTRERVEHSERMQSGFFSACAFWIPRVLLKVSLNGSFEFASFFPLPFFSSMDLGHLNVSEFFFFYASFLR